jgi:hypothetical protein
MKITVATDQGTHLLISNGDRFAVIEWHDDRFYNSHDDDRDSAKDTSAVRQILESGDWTDEAATRQAFDEVVGRETELAQRLR